eukprot:CAMPEP_0204606950 /NCGR_PEP_ID=MMETSP0661-20131031/59388_1 /ASSEMBLY_ACC=CAM_ASM_000606 /TAXON_ID=109239 /ORGANISM="Alexandrium margalefi, Strain AMGDE01CS-322" /LENGTH=1037 /DNA_ID=CAMNT_0051618313 /DNA_START=45 /DNA_END=3158 /DNA_ORIENTATION=+
MSTAMAKRRAAKGQYDVVLGEVSSEAVGSLIVQNLSVKGFCVVNPGFTESVLQKAVKDSEELDFYQVNGAVADGLLGAEGSCRIADLESGLEDEARSEGDSLKAMDHTMTRIGYIMEPYIDRIGFGVTHRSAGVLSRSGEAEDETPPLNELEVSKWQSQFLRHRLMVVIFLGPKAGNLDLEPFDTADAEAYQIKATPGTMVLLRPDKMTHKLTTSGDSFALSSFYMTDVVKKRAPEGGWRLTPPAKVIEDWTLKRLQDLKAMEDFGVPNWDPEIPDGWRKAMNQTYHKGQMSGIAGVGVHYVGTYDFDDFICAATNGPDYATDVPIVRWNHDDTYDPDPEGWQRGKAYCKHGCFMEGTELFDNKFFNLSPNESRQLDPHQRLLMEQGYNALAHMGYKKKQLMNSAGGIYVGCGTDEWAFHTGRQGFGGVTGALCMYSGRFSFCLGMKGPAITLTTEAASGLSATYIAAESVQKKGLAVSNDFAVAVGVHILLAPMWWPNHCMLGWYSATGRCQSFNASADGYIRGDGCAAVGLKGATSVIDGKVIQNDKDEFIGTIPGAMMNTSGKIATLATPSGPGEQECIVAAVRNAGISPLDLDCVEGHMNGKFLDEAIELNSLWRAHRSDVNKDPLCYTAGKCSFANTIEASGITALLRVVYSSQYGHMTPSLHLRQSNPHSDPFEQPMMFANENMEFPYKSAYSGVLAKGFGGTNVYCLGWGTLSNEKVPPTAPAMQREVIFWPGGGGALEGDMVPRRRDGYTIVGSWSKWEVAEKMDVDGDGVYGFTLTLGENRWEQFQIWLDGDPTRVLHPGVPRVQQSSEVYGPEPEWIGGAQACRTGTSPSWMIDGRQELVEYPRPADAVKALKDKDEAEAENIMVGMTEAGKAGDQYRVQLEIKGKWRMVTWEKLPSTSSEDVAKGKYYVSASWRNWELEEMVEDQVTPGTYTLEAMLFYGTGSFQIIRNEDWAEVFYPNPDTAAAETVMGPDDLGGDLSWTIDGKAGDKFSIQFQRSFEDGKDAKKVSWTHTGHEPVTFLDKLSKY